MATQAVPIEASTSASADDQIEDDQSAPPVSILAKLIVPSIVDINIKHPLANKWVMWFDYPQAGGNQKGNYLESLHKIYTIGTIEDFWAVFNNVADAHIVPTGSTYHFFKEGINPMWEDPQNKLGGKWVMGSSNKALADMWESTLLALIGEQFHPHETDICGAVMAKRVKGDKVSVWTRNYANKDSCMAIGHALKAAVKMEANIKMGYQAHEDALRRNQSYNNTDRYNIPEASSSRRY